MAKPKKPPTTESPLPELAPAKKPDEDVAGLTPWTVLQAAVKAVLALKYALGVLGIVSAIAIIKGFGIDFRIAVFGTILMMVLMTALVVFAALTKSKSHQIRAAALVMMWSFLALTIFSATLLFTSAFFDYPKPLTQLLGLAVSVPDPRPGKQEANDPALVKVPNYSTTTVKDRLQIQNDFLPLIEDKSIAFHRRCLALAECINAEIFRGEVAFEKSAQLMNELPESLDEQRLSFPQLVEALSPLVPKHLDFIQRHFGMANGVGGRPQRQGVAVFWWSVFQDAMQARTPECLAALADPKLLANERFREFNGLCANLPDEVLEKMKAVDAPGIRALAALQQVNASPPGNATAIATVKSLLNGQKDDDLSRSAELI